MSERAGPPARTRLRDAKASLLRHWARLVPAALAHAQADYPREACGLLLKQGRKVSYLPCRNAAALQTGKDSFQLHPQDWAAAEDAGVVLAVVHSHPDDDAHPSPYDIGACTRSGLPWFIVSWPGAAWRLQWPEPLPLVGRAFAHGVVDCYSLVRDYYAQLGLVLPDFERADDWWVETPDRQPANLYRDNFAAAGFVDLGQAAPQLHDVLLMRVASRVENHAAVYVGPDPAMPGTAPRILQHLHGRLSGHDIWGGEWQRRTSAVLRHTSLLN